MSNASGVRQMIADRLNQGPLDPNTARQISAMGYRENVDVPGVVDAAVLCEGDRIRGYVTGEVQGELTEWVAYTVGPWQPFDPDRFDVDAVNRELALRFPAPDDFPGGSHPVVTANMNAVTGRRMAELRTAARIGASASSAARALT